MIEVGLFLLAVLPQTENRIDFSLEPGAVLVAIAFFVLVNLLLAFALYPYFKGSSTSEEKSEATRDTPEHDQKDMVQEAPADDGEPLEEKVDDFLEDIHEERGR